MVHGKGEYMKLVNIRKVYHNKNNSVEALKGIHLEFEEKGLIILLGASGSGKTTLLNILSGQDKNFEGQLVDVPEIEYLTQEFNLFENMSIIDNLLIVKNDIPLIEDYLHQFELWEHKDKKVKEVFQRAKETDTVYSCFIVSTGFIAV